METPNRLQVSLGNPVLLLNAHKSVQVQQDNFKNALTISFMRTIRVPDDSKTYNLPPKLGEFPLYNVQHYKPNLPLSMVSIGGVFMPVHEREALWIHFKSAYPFAVSITIGGVNVVSGQPASNTSVDYMRRMLKLTTKKPKQDYVVVDPAKKGQLWLDGVAKADGKVMQFVGVRSGTGYSVEAQVGGFDDIGGIQISVTPIQTGRKIEVTLVQMNHKEVIFRVRSSWTVLRFCRGIADHIGVPVDQFTLLHHNRRLSPTHLLSHYGIINLSTINLVLNLQGGGLIKALNSPTAEAEMGIAAGGLVRQVILGDPHGSTAWDYESTIMFNVQLLNALLFRSVTGIAPPPSPVTAATYAAAGLPFFVLPAEVKSGIKGSFSGIKSMIALDRKKEGKVGLKKELMFTAVQLDRSGVVPAESVDDMRKRFRQMSLATGERALVDM